MSRIKLKEGNHIPRDFVITKIDPSPPNRPLAPSQRESFPNPYGVKVYAPVGGQVLRIIEKNERILSAGAPILEIGNPNSLEIVVDVLSGDATNIRPGAEILVENWGGAEVLKGHVRTIEPQAFTKLSALGVEEQRVNVVADLTDKKNAKLGDNYRLDIRIVGWQSSDVLKVASSALFRHGEKWGVFVIDGGTARLREITVGHQTASETEITEGLREGETVVLHPPNSLADGKSVRTQ